MAPLAKYFHLIFIISLTLFFHANARDSQFFSKVTNTNNENTQVKVDQKPTKEEPLKSQENGQNFVQDPPNGYGLWGHGSGQNPPDAAESTTGATVAATATKTNNEAYVSDPQGTSDTRFAQKGYTTSTNTDHINNNGAFVADPQGFDGESKYPSNYNTEAYVTNPHGLSDTRFAEKGYTTSGTNSNHYYNNGAYVADPRDSSDNYNTEAYVTKPQGMSDTRFSNQWYSPDSSSSSKNNNYYGNGAYVADPEGSSTMRYTSSEYPNNYNTEAYVTNPQGTRFAEKEYTTSSSNNNNYYDNGAYAADPRGSSGTHFEENGYTTTTNKNYYNNGNPQGTSNNNNYYYNGANNYNTQKQGMSDTRFLENGKYHYELKGENNYPNGYNYNSNNNNNNNNNNYDNGVKRYTTQQYGLSGTSLEGNNYNSQRQGMSDTRFLENGKYHYDLRSENNYGHGYGNTRGINYNNQGYNGNSYEENNYMGGYQNQEFEENLEEEYVP